MLRFGSNAFRDLPEDEAETNPGMFGQSLAYWISRQLARRGYTPGEVIAEDFGWCVPLSSKPIRLYVGCSGGAGDPAQWRVFVFAESGLWSRLFGADAEEFVARAFEAVKGALESAREVEGLREEALVYE